MVKGMSKSRLRMLVVFAAAAALACMTLLVTALGAARVKAEGEAQSAWKSSKAVYDEETGLTKVSDAIVANGTDILTLPNKTAYFQMRVNKSAAWSGLAFLNGLTSETKGGSWSDVTWPGINKGVDTLPHLIIQDGGGQIYGNGVETIYPKGPRGVTGVPTLSTQLVGVELHIGTVKGTEGDVSYIKINGTQLTNEDNAVTAIGHLAAEDFPNGCYLGAHFNMDASSPRENYLTEYGSPITTAVSGALNATIPMNQAEPVASDQTFTVRNLADRDSAVLKINGVAVDEQYYTAANVANDETAITYTIKKDFWKNITLKRASVFTVESTNGKAVVMLSVQNAPPPVWKNDSYVEIEAIADTDFVFTYETGKTLTAADITVHSGVYSGNVDKKTALEAGVDYTLTAGESNAYTLTIKKEFLESVLDVYHGRYFNIQIGEDQLNAQLYHVQSGDGWIARSIDLKADTQLSVDDYYTTGTYVTFNQTKLVPRVYYNQGVDVTKPIFAEFFGPFDDGTEWAMIQVADSLKTMDYFSDGFGKESMLQAIFFGGRNDIQKLAGFQSAASTNASYPVTKMKGIVVEIFFGAEKEDGYVKINGVEAGKPEKVQSDFADGKAYVSWFVNRKGGAFDLTLNSHINAVAIAGPTDDALYTMDLADAKDFAVTLQNVSDSIAVKNESGKTLVSGTDYAFDATTGQLTIKKEYFSSIAFRKQGTIYVWDNTAETGTKFNMTYTSSNMQSSLVAFGVKGALTDAVFTLPSGVTKIDALLKTVGDSTEEVDSAKYSFDGGKLTIKKEALSDSVGTTEFLAASGSAIYPLYVHVQAFADGGAKISGDGTLRAKDGAYIVNGDMSYTLMQAFDFNAGFTVKVDFKSIPGYYEGGRNFNKTGYVSLKFYDPYTGYTFLYTLYTNNSDENITTTDTALFERYEIVDSEGNSILLATTRGVNVAESQNTSALGVHLIKFETAGSGLKITVDNARATTVSDMKGFNLSASVCTVDTPKGATEAAMELGYKFYVGEEVADYSKIEIADEQQGGEERPGGCGCGTFGTGGIGGGIAVGLVLLLGGTIAAVFFVKRSRTNG